MRARDQQGRFVNRLELNNEFQFLVTLYKLIPLLILIYLLFKYLHISEFLLKVLIETACGPNCKCSCENGTKGWT